MASYKVIQDIEAEDKLLGPLTLRQFIYALIVAALGFIAFMMGRVNLALIVPFLPFIVFFGLLASPFGTEQSSEVWLLAKIRFFIKPRVRIWDQSGMSELVTITVPKREEKIFTDGLSQREVKSRLRSLADVIDSRGWSTKNVTVNSYISPVYQMASSGLRGSADRLISMNDLPADVPSFSVGVNDDMLDESNNPRAQQLSQMIAASEVSHHKQAVALAQGQQPSVPPAYPGPTPQQSQSAFVQAPQTTWFGGSPSQQAFTPATMPSDPSGQGVPLPPVYAQQPSAEEEAELLQHIHDEEQSISQWSSHLKTILPPEEQRKRDLELAHEEAARRAAEAQDKIAAEMTRHANPAILELAGNDDLDVATIARQAHRSENNTNENEVVVRLH